MNADTYSQDEVQGAALEDEKVDPAQNVVPQNEFKTEDVDRQLGEKDPGKRIIVCSLITCFS